MSQIENQDIIQAFDKISDLDWIGVNDRDEKPRSHEDKMAEEKAAASLRFVGGRYQIGVPWKDDIPDLQCNYATALSRLEKTENSLKKRGEHLGERYNEILEEYQKKGYMKKYSYEDWMMNVVVAGFYPTFQW